MRAILAVHKWVYGLGLFVAAAAVAQGPPAPVRTGQVQKGKVVQHRMVVGQIEPKHRVIVAAEESGRVVVAPPEPGTSVKANQPLAETDTTLIDLDIQTAETQIVLAAAQRDERASELKITQREVDRLKKLVADKAARLKELEDVTDQHSAAKSRLAFAVAMHARGKLALARLVARRKKTTVLAPFDGVVVSKRTERGAWLDTGDPVVEFIVISTVKVSLRVPQNMMKHIQPDAEVDIRVDAVGLRLTGKPHRLVPDGDPASRSFKLLIKLDNAKRTLKPGMSVVAYLPTGGETEALSVPRDAVQTTPRGAVVFAVRGGMAVLVPVTVRFGTQGRFIVDGDLKPGERVVVEGNARLRPGQVLQDLGDLKKPADSKAGAGS